MFTPFAFRSVKIEEAPAPPSWTPADFTNIKAWWKADAGITLNATYPGSVARWEDQVNGYFVTQSRTSAGYANNLRMPTTGSSSDLNNQAIVNFGIVNPSSFPNGAPQYLYSTGSFPALNSESYTQIIICDYISSKTTGEAYSAPLVGQINFSNTKRFWFDRILSTGNVRNVIQLGVGSPQLVDSGDLLALGTEAVMWSQYQAGTADTYWGLNTTTGSLEYNGATTNDTWSTTTLFAINAPLLGTSNVGGLFNTRANNMDVAEVILIYGEPSASEWAQFKDYVATKYGITIS